MHKLKVSTFKGLFEEYAAFGRGHGHDLAPYDRYHQVRDSTFLLLLTVKETLWRFAKKGSDPYAKRVLIGISGKPDGKARSSMLIRSAT